MVTSESVSTVCIQPCGNTNAECLSSASIQLRAKCTLEHFCDECNEFFPSDLVLSFLLPSVRLDLFDIFFHTLATLPLHFPPPFLERRRMTPSSLPFVLWANSVELFYGLELRAASATQH